MSQEIIRVFIGDLDPQAYEVIDDAEVEERVVKIVGRASGPGDVLGAIREAQPDVVVLDGDAPELDAMNLMQNAFRHNLPVGGILLWAQQDNNLIRQAMRAGVEDFLIKPVDPEALVASVASVHEIVRDKFPGGWVAGEEALARAAEAVGKGHVIIVSSGQAAVGKTTLATNLAVALAQVTKKKVLLVDLEHSDAAVLLNLKPQTSLADLAEQSADLDEDTLPQVVMKHSSGISLLPGTVHPDFRTFNAVKPELLNKALALARKAYDFIVVIMPYPQSREQLDLLSLGDKVLCVTTAWNLLEMRKTKSFIEALSEEGICDGDRLMVVLNRASKDSFITQQDLQKAIQREVAVAIPNQMHVATASINLGVPFVISDPNNEATLAIRHLAGVLSGMEAPAEQKEKKGGLFGRGGRP